MTKLNDFFYLKLVCLVIVSLASSYACVDVLTAFCAICFILLASCSCLENNVEIVLHKLMN